MNWEQAAVQEDGPVQEEPRMTGTRKSMRSCCGFHNEDRRHCRRLRQQVEAVERHEFEASNTKLEHETCRHCQESRISVESVHQQLTTGETVEDQRDWRTWKIGDEDRDGCPERRKHWSSRKTVEKDRDGWSTSRKADEKVKTGGVKVGDLVKKIQTDE